MANHQEHRQSSEPIKAQANSIQPAKAWENCARASRVDFGFISDWMRKWREILKAIKKCSSNAKQKQMWIAFDSPTVKTVLTQILLLIISKILWNKWIVLRVLWSIMRRFIVVRMGELETAEVLFLRLFSVFKHQCVRMHYWNFVGEGVLCVNQKTTSLQ